MTNQWAIFLSTTQKHNRQNFEHNRLGPGLIGSYNIENTITIPNTYT